jgi:small conductance mechanosensitive channel
VSAASVGATGSSRADPCGGDDWVCARVYDATSNEALASAVSWLADKPLRILAILVAAFVANRVMRHLVRNSITRTISGADRLGGVVPSGAGARRRRVRAEARAATLGTVAASMVTAVVVFFALTSVLSVLGVSLAALLASAGVVGVALGFGAQNLVRDVLAGWFILAEDRYGVGDTIDAGAPAVGVVERVTLRSTRLRAEDGTVWHVANGEILKVGNRSQGAAGAAAADDDAGGGEGDGGVDGGAAVGPGAAEVAPGDGPPP